jgi:drug/metabolite transporter superfamily protein YnfA
MANLTALLALAFAAALEAGGDAIVRTGLHAHANLQRIGTILLGGLVLTAYGLFVNTPQWDFGRLLGVYVSLFFVAAQIINAFVFRVSPSLPILVGGSLIIGGGLLMTFWQIGPR